MSQHGLHTAACLDCVSSVSSSPSSSVHKQLLEELGLAAVNPASAWPRSPISCEVVERCWRQNSSPGSLSDSNGPSTAAANVSCRWSNGHSRNYNITDENDSMKPPQSSPTVSSSPLYVLAYFFSNF